ncbi:MAG TPA: acetyl-CoA carboxylase biotin carboxyl carrier protein subunit [Lacunisphaera sp.]|nr:acetyl-CoA carboxylase biotin carboxyl carrier protein subunit [Lacunisphaera sp.]
MRNLRVTVDGKAYNVLVEIDDDGFAPPRAAVAAVAAPLPPIPAPAPAVERPAPPAVTAGSGSVVSPLPGKVVSIDVKLGDAVAEGAQVATLEAMKMNTFVTAPRAGKVVEIHAQPGDAVEEGAPLVTLG